MEPTSSARSPSPGEEQTPVEWTQLDFFFIPPEDKKIGAPGGGEGLEHPVQDV